MAARSKKSKPAAETNPSLTEEQQQQQAKQAREQAENAAQCELELVRLFLQHEKRDIARRRLETILVRYAQTEAAAEANRLLQGL